MWTAYDIAWRSLLALAAPFTAFSPKFRHKARRAMRERMALDLPEAPPGDGRTCVMIHAVSLGEINATRTLVKQLSAARADLRFLVTVTTDTGYARGKELYANEPLVTLARFPLDLSPAIERLFDRQQPAVVVLMELEVWPNLVLHCHERGVPVAVINGRLTGSSYRHYKWARSILKPTFARLSAVCAQDQQYADRFTTLGVRPEVVSVTGTMKFDTAQVADRITGDAELAADMGLLREPPAEGVKAIKVDNPLWVVGSSGPGEETLVLSAYRRLLASHPTLRLAIIPRHPERFDAVADLIRQAGFSVLRRSATRIANHQPIDQLILSSIGTPLTQHPVLLGDTMGELRKFYALADVILVGRTLVDLGPRQRGSDMIETAALAKPVIVGRWTHNFADAVRALTAAGGLKVIQDAGDLPAAVAEVLASPSNATDLGHKARQVVLEQQGATARHVAVVLSLLGTVAK